MKIFFFLSFFSTQFCFQAIGQDRSLVIKTENGVLKDTLEKSGIRSFKGIPFAVPPVDEPEQK